MQRTTSRALVGLSSILLIAVLGCGNSTVTIAQNGQATGTSGANSSGTATHTTSNPTATATHSAPNPTATATHAPPPPAPPYFVQTATAGNSSYDYTKINNSLINGNPNAILMATPNWNPGGTGRVYDNHPIGVYYYANTWAIFNQDRTAIPVGAAFNVWVVPSSDHPFVWKATSASLGSDYTVIDNATTNGDSTGWLLVTPNWNPPGSGGIYDNHPIGVFYTGGKWAIFNQDLASIPVGASFNVVNVESIGGYQATATSYNSSGDYMTLPAALTSGSSHALIFITANWNPNGGSSDVYNNHNTGVWWTGTQWAIFNQDVTPIPNNAAFNTTTLGG